MAKITTLDRILDIIPDPSAAASAKILDHLDEQGLRFITRSPFLVMATMGEAGLDLSPKGDDPGFVKVLDNRTLLVPERNGNQLKMGLRNILRDGQIGLLFFRPATGDTLRIIGRAEIYDDADLCESLTSHGKPALLAIKISIDRAFFHCPRALLRAQLWKPESWDRPEPISLGKIIGKAMGRKDIAEAIDKIGDERNAELWI